MLMAALQTASPAFALLTGIAFAYGAWRVTGRLAAAAFAVPVAAAAIVGVPSMIAALGTGSVTPDQFRDFNATYPVLSAYAGPVALWAFLAWVGLRQSLRPH